MKLLFEGKLSVSYSQLYLRGSDDDDPAEFTIPFVAQANGLCGVAVDGFACLMTGTHTGEIDMRVELHDAAPPIDAEWQEVVEASFTPWVTPAVLVGLMGGSAARLELECVDYRMRYCASGMDEGNRIQPQRAAVPERYLLQFWAAPPAWDCVLRETSSTAGSWHRHARGLLHRMLKTPEELQQEVQQQSKTSLGEMLAGFAPDLPDLIAAAGAEKQRSIARRVVHRACELAGLASIDWIAAALAAMDRGQPLPDPFTDESTVSARVLADSRITKVSGHWWVDDNFVPRSQQDLAAQAIFGAIKGDPAQAAIDAVAIAVASCNDLEQIVAEVRSWLAH